MHKEQPDCLWQAFPPYSGKIPDQVLVVRDVPNTTARADIRATASSPFLKKRTKKLLLVT
jgi:hypothetical protein